MATCGFQAQKAARRKEDKGKTVEVEKVRARMGREGGKGNRLKLESSTTVGMWVTGHKAAQLCTRSRSLNMPTYV